MCIRKFHIPPYPRRREPSGFEPRTCLDSWIPACAGMTGGFRQRGASLVELIMFIVIISVAVVGVLQVMNLTTAHSADPLVRKQALAIAESLLEEIELMPFTYCDLDDAGAASATSTAGCANSQDVITGPAPGSETRYSTVSPFDNVADYSNCRLNISGGSAGCDSAGNGGITDITNNRNIPLDSYNASVAISRAGVALLGAVEDGAALRITVTVTGPGNTTVELDGYRTRYAPNDLP